MYISVCFACMFCVYVLCVCMYLHVCVHSVVQQSTSVRSCQHIIPSESRLHCKKITALILDLTGKTGQLGRSCVSETAGEVTYRASSPTTAEDNTIAVPLCFPHRHNSG